MGIFLVLWLFLGLSTGFLINFQKAILLVAVVSVGLIGLIRPLMANNLTNVLLSFYAEMQVLLYGAIGFWVAKNPNSTAARKFFGIIVLGYAITAVTTIVGNAVFPQASRYLASVSSVDLLYQRYVSRNIGSFTFSYEVVLMLPLLIYAIKEKTIPRFWSVALLVLSGIVVFVMEYTTALLVFAVSLLLFFIRRPTAKKIKIFVAMCITAVIIGSTLFINLFEWLGQTIENEEIASRMLFIAELLEGRISDVSASGVGRLEFYQTSLETFFNSSLLGGWNEMPLGGHSFILDTLGNYGIFGGACIVAIYYALYRICLRPYKKEKIYPYLLWMYLVTIIMAIVNPKIYLFVFLCVVPVFARVIQSNGVKRR